jgi:hypothetical protein
MAKMPDTPVYTARETHRSSATPKSTPYRTAYTGPVKNRGVDTQGRAKVSREELADFQRKYGANMTLRDLLNADRTGKPPAKATPKADAKPAGRTAADRDTPSARAEIPKGDDVKAPAKTDEGMSETRRNIANIASALPAARAVSMAGKAAQSASAGRAASKAAPMARREPELGLPAQGRVFRSARPDAEAAKQAEYMRRVEELGLKKGGTTKAYAKGGSVKGGGCETRSKKTRFI